MAKKPDFRQLTVQQCLNVSANMRRVILTGAALHDFPRNSEGGYIKLLFTHAGTALTGDNQHELEPGSRPVMRTYTVRYFDAEKQRLSVDFVMHEHNGVQGIASHWAANAQEGDQIMIAGPGPVKHLNQSADWFFLAGDMTALPALSCNLERLPLDAKGYAVIEITEEADQQILVKPEGIHIEWVIKAEQKLPKAVESLTWLEGTAAVWAACEFSMMRQLRQYFKNERKVERENLYISSYWKAGRSEEEHKVDKRKDAEQETVVS